MNDEPIILASGSPWRLEMLERAGLNVTADAPGLDERALEAPLAKSGAEPADIALVLAQAKADTVSTRHPGRWVVGCDQTLELDGEALHKVDDMEGARRRLLALQGRTHVLNSAVVLARDGASVWEHVARPAMTMRPLDPAFIGRHLAQAGDAVLGSVGAYQFEGVGAQLFERVEGDLFSIVGLPLLPLLAALRERGAMDG